MQRLGRAEDWVIRRKRLHGLCEHVLVGEAVVGSDAHIKVCGETVGKVRRGMFMNTGETRSGGRCRGRRQAFGGVMRASGW